MRKKNKLVYGVGNNDADYPVVIKTSVDGKMKQTWLCPYYNTWSSMLFRVYSDKFVNKSYYKECSVCSEWLLFSNFRSWMEKQDWQGRVLDKDLLVTGNKIYSPETCMFVTHKINTFMNEYKKGLGQYKIGCYWDSRLSKFRAQCSNPFTKKRIYLGLFETEDAAHEAWGVKKLEFAKALALLETDNRVAAALIARYEQYGQ